MLIFFETASKKNEPIEIAIAEAIAAFEKRFGCRPTVVRIHRSEPASVHAPEGMEIQRVINIQPGHARAGGDMTI